MKIATPLLAMLAAGFLGHSAFGSCPSLALCVAQDGHGFYHITYYQTAPMPDTSVALFTGAGGVSTSGPGWQRPLPDNGDVKLVVGNDQHGQARMAYIPVTSHFAPAGQ